MVVRADDRESTSEVAQRLRRRLAESAPAGVAAVYLFGSQAERRAHRESDVDLGVLLRWEAYPSAAERFERGLRFSGEIAPEGKISDIVVLNDAPPTLAARIVSEGRLLFCPDPELEHTFRRDAQLRAADLAPFLRRMARLKLESLRR